MEDHPHHYLIRSTVNHPLPSFSTLSSPVRRESLRERKMGKPKSEQPPLILKDRKGKKERWLLTRKTWRYMSDAGRKLIPEGFQNRQEDIPKIEAYFQEVCQREPKFLLWRKSSYPGAVSFRTHSRRIRPRKKGGSYREKASSADEAEDIKKHDKNFTGGKMLMTPTTAGRFDLLKLSADKPGAQDELLNELEIFLQSKPGENKILNHQELFEKLQKYLQDVQDIQKEMALKHRSEIIMEPPQKELLDAIRRHYSKSANREAVISNLLTDRKLLEKLYFDLRKTRGFRSGTAYLPDCRSVFTRANVTKEITFSSTPTDITQPKNAETNSTTSPSTDSPPVIEVQKTEFIQKLTQTPKIHPEMMKVIEEKLKKEEEEQTKAQSPKKTSKTSRRRSSLDHDDVSPSVGDTIKRYLKMARKKSIDTDKKDRFKTINYDENLRNIKPKGETITIGNDDGQHKGCQVGESWIGILKDLKMEEHWIIKDHKEVKTISEEKSVRKNSDDGCVTTSAGSQQKTGLLSSGQLFLSNLLHGLQHGDKNSVLPTVMQKSKSSTSVGRNLVSKKIWKGRSKSQSRLSTTQPCSWTPQGNCVWSNLVGKQVTLTDTNILQLNEIERRILQKVAVAKLQALNIGCQIQIPSEVSTSQVEIKTKRRPHLLKRKAITTSFFDTNRGKEKEGAISTGASGMVFGVPLGQCIENERLSRNASSTTFKSKDSATFPDDSDLGLKRKSHHGSRTSFSSLTEPKPQEESAGSTDSLGSSVPGVFDAISVESAADVTLNATENEPSVPHIVSSCLRHIETRGLHTLGIFRVSSSKKRVRQLRECFDSGKEICLDEYCPHDVATLLKEYFRDLPEPLLCKDLYHAFVQTQKLRNRKLQFEALQHLIQLLPVSNRDTLWSLLNFLSLIAANCDDHKDKSGETVPGNKMDSNNLATLFAPNILHCCNTSNDSKELLSSQSCEERIDVINVIRSMIDHNKRLFQVSAELLDEVYLHMMDTNPNMVDQLLRKKEAAEENFDDPDSEVLEEIGTGSESSSLPQSPKAFGESETVVDKEEKRIFSREQFLHDKNAFEMLETEVNSRAREKNRSKTTAIRRTRRESTTRLMTKTPNRQFENKYQDDESGSFAFYESSGILKASLTIPTSSFTLNLDDSDIPFIEDSNSLHETLKHQKSISTVRTKKLMDSTSSKYRSTNGSDSSQSMIPMNVQSAVGSNLTNQGTSSYDSALETSTPFSSPPRYTATSSGCSSSDREYFSSPPSWGSSSPLSPDSYTPLDELSDDAPISRIGRITIPNKIVTESVNVEKEDRSEKDTKLALKSQKRQEKVTKPKETFEASETRRSLKESEKKQELSKSVTKDIYQRVHSLVGNVGGSGNSGGASAQTLSQTLTKSASSSQLIKKGEEADGDSSEWSRKVTTSISSIGGAVMRSKTADIERMLKIRPEVKKLKGKTEMKISTKTDTEKKIMRKRYTDSRHLTKQIPDLSSKTLVSPSPKSQSIWKRREIISSSPKSGEDS